MNTSLAQSLTYAVGSIPTSERLKPIKYSLYCRYKTKFHSDREASNLKLGKIAKENENPNKLQHLYFEIYWQCYGCNLLQSPTTKTNKQAKKTHTFKQRKNTIIGQELHDGNNTAQSGSRTGCRRSGQRWTSFCQEPCKRVNAKKRDKVTVTLIFTAFITELLKLHFRLICLTGIYKGVNKQQCREMTSRVISETFFTLTNPLWGQTGPSIRGGGSERHVSGIKPLGSVMNMQQEVKGFFFFLCSDCGRHKGTWVTTTWTHLVLLATTLGSAVGLCAGLFLD